MLEVGWPQSKEFKPWHIYIYIGRGLVPPFSDKVDGSNNMWYVCHFFLHDIMTPHDTPVAQAADSWQEALEVLDILEERQEGNGNPKTISN